VVRKESLQRALGPLREGQQRMLYLTQFGDRVQLRMRVFPHPSAEGILWESPADPGGGDAAYQPSPLWTRVVITWWRRWKPGRVGPGDLGPRVFIVPLAEGKAEELPARAEFVWWKDENTLSLLTQRGEVYFVGGGSLETRSTLHGEECSYDIPTRRQSSWQKHPGVLARLESLHRTPIGLVEGLAVAGQLPLRLREGEIGPAVLHGIGFPRLDPLIDPLWIFPAGVAAVSPNGRHLALTGITAQAVFICSLHRTRESATGCSVVETIRLPKLVNGETAYADDLRWSADSRHLTFSEKHYHPANFFRPDTSARYPDPVETTELVRLYSLTPKGGKVTTVAAGRNAYLMPLSWKVQRDQPDHNGG